MRGWREASAGLHSVPRAMSVASDFAHTAIQLHQPHTTPSPAAPPRLVKGGEGLLLPFLGNEGVARSDGVVAQRTTGYRVRYQPHLRACSTPYTALPPEESPRSAQRARTTCARSLGSLPASTASLLGLCRRHSR